MVSLPSFRQFACLALAAGLSAPPAALLGQENQLPAAVERTVSYERDIAPLLAQHCLACHGPDKQESHFRLDRRASWLKGGDFGEPAAIPGKSEESLLIRAVAGLDSNLSMPPEGERLTAEQIGLLRAWIDQGLPGLAGGDEERPTTDHWSFQPIANSPIPAWPASAATFPRQPIDAFIADRLHAIGLSLSAEADKRTLIRRLYLDTLGLMPAFDEIQAFEQDARPDAYERLVERVLASPRFGERWARHWLDAVRFAETNGFETNTPRPNAFYYRDYVIRALNADKPYDRFVFEQLAGDVVGEDAATGFLVAGAYDTVKSPDIQLTLMQRQDELADIINVTGGAFLGLTIGCARCHSHKFDPIPQRDYYSLQAIFAGVKHGDRPLRTPEAMERERRRSELQQQLADVKQQLASLTESSGSDSGRRENLTAAAVLLDDAHLDDNRRVELLVAPTGHGNNPSGNHRGARDDAGDVQRLPNVSSGKYTWWRAMPEQRLAAYRPQLEGRFDIWVSWGCGWETHARDAAYVLDLDGDPLTENDQQTLLSVDQRLYADGTQPPQNQALWSDFRWAGTCELRRESCLLLANGATPAAVTADVVLFAPATSNAAADAPPSLPRLNRPVNAQKNVDEFAPIQAKFVRFRILATNQAEPCLDELVVFAIDGDGGESRNVALAELGVKASSSGDYSGNPKHRLEHIHDGRYGNSFSWISNQVGAGWVQLELVEPARIHRVVWARDREGHFKDRLPVRYLIEVAETPDQWRTVSGSDTRVPFGMPDQPPVYRFAELPLEARERAFELLAEQARVEDAIASFPAPLVSYSGVYEQPGATHRLYRGDPMQQREVVPPDALTVIESLELGLESPEPERRAALARWITSPDNPLAARVMVNRIWHHHFGAGLVATPSDFGANGARPTHPELLDWLATELIQSQWSLKHIHRLILTSAVYRQSSAPHADALRLDGQTRLLWRYPPRRLEAEAIHDLILQASGSLDLRMYGQGYDVFEPNTNYVRNYVPKEELGPAEWRRMIYMTKVRMEQDAVFGVFDCPDAGQAAPVRPRSTTAIQALNLFNSRFVQQHATRLAERASREAADNRSAQIRLLFRGVLGRDPATEELEASEELAAEFGLSAVCRALLNCNEFLFIP